MSTRDKYDRGNPGKAALEREERIHQNVRRGTQERLAWRTIYLAQNSPERHVVGTLEHALLEAYATVERAERGR